MIIKHLKILVALVLATKVLSQSAWTNYSTSNSGIASNLISEIITDKKGNLWIGTDNGLSKFDGINWTTFNTSNSGLVSNNITKIKIDNLNNNLWIITDDGYGLCSFSGTNWTTYNTTNSGLAAGSINLIVIDNNGNKWIGTKKGGLNKFDGKNWQTYNTKNSGIASNNIKQIEIDSKGKIWIGTDNGLSKFDGTNWQTYNTINCGIANNQINQIYIDNKGKIWIGTNNGLSIFDEINWTTYNITNSGISGDYINNLVEDNFGNKWVVTNGGYGLCRYNGTNWTTYKTTNSGISGNQVSDIKKDSLGNVWFLTNEGLSKFDGNKWLNIYFRNSEYISGKELLIDSKSNKWIISDLGLNTLKPRAELSTLCDNNTISYSINKVKQCSDSYSIVQLLNEPKGNIIWNHQKNDYSDSLLQNNTREIKVKEGRIYVSISDSFCTNKGTVLEIKILTDTTLKQPDICMITNQNNHNLVVWENINNDYILKYRIYKQNQYTSSYELVHEQSKNENSKWVDLLSIPNSKIDRYKISIFDSCGNETPLSDEHTTILLSSNVGLNGTVNLAWNRYEGFEYPNFEIWRSTDGVNFNLLSSVANNTFAYIDNTPPINAWYQIRITKQDVCTPTKRGDNYVGSNIISKEGKSLSINELKSEPFFVYPNPTEDLISINNVQGKTLRIVNITGLEVYNGLSTSDKTEISLKSIGAKGVYILHVLDAQGVTIENKKIVLE